VDLEQHALRLLASRCFVKSGRVISNIIGSG